MHLRPSNPVNLNQVYILDKAQTAGHLIPGGGVTHIQYRDDAMIIVEGCSSFCASKQCLARK